MQYNYDKKQCVEYRIIRNNQWSTVIDTITIYETSVIMYYCLVFVFVSIIVYKIYLKCYKEIYTKTFY